MRTLFFLLCLFITSATHAQYVQNVNALQRQNEAGNMVMFITYDLLASNNQIPFKVNVSFKTKGKEIQLKNLSGSHGDLIYPGSSKEIIWDYQEELVHFSGDGEINVVAVPNINIVSRVKRGKELSVKLDPVFEKGRQYSVELYRYGKNITTLGNFSADKDHVEFTVSSKVKAKKGYQLKIVGGENELFSETFAIKPRIPLVVKMIPLVGSAVFIVMIALEPEPESPLPGAPSID